MGTNQYEEYKIFEFGEIQFSKEQLLSLPAHQLQFIGQSALAANDVSAHLKMVLLHFHSESSHDVLRNLNNLSAAIYQRGLQAKIFEFVKTVDDFRKRAKRAKDPLFENMQAEMEQVIDFIKSSNCYKVLKELRDQVTNHYAFMNWSSSIKRFQDGHRFKIYMHRANGNSFYPFAEEASHLSLFDNPEYGNVTAEDLFQYTGETNKALVSLQQKIFLIIFKSKDKNFRMRGVRVFVPNRLIFDDETRCPLLSLKDGSGRW